MNKTLTIIIPTFNTASYLDKCFNSLVVSNLYFIKKYKITVLFINDGSTDDSQKIIDGFKYKYDFVSSIYQENQGLSMARNAGISQITSDFFMLLDSDDWLNMSEFEKVYQKFLNENLDFISFGMSYYGENSHFTAHRTNQPVKYNQILNGISFLNQGFQPSSACLFIFNTNFIIKNNLFFKKGIMQEDVEFTFRMMLAAQNGLFIQAYVYNYYRHSNSMTVTKDKMRLKRYLLDSILVADYIKLNKSSSHKNYYHLIEQNYNSVTWNLLWRFISNPKEVDYDFKMVCLNDLKTKGLYPIKGELKTTFQKLTTLFFNQEFIVKVLLKR